MHFFKIALVVLTLYFITSLGKINAATPYDIFQFVQQSPLAFCYGTDICGDQPVLPRTFTTHGLWPSSSTNPAAPLTCAGTAFSRSEMNDPDNQYLQLLLSYSWPNFNIRQTNMDFWEYEYNKHGRCSDNTFSQTQYFREAYRLWSTYNALHLFSQTTWIVPGYPYRYIDLELAIRRTIGGKAPLLMCKYNGVSPYLVEVVICFDYTAANPVDCVRTTNCGNPNALAKGLGCPNGLGEKGFGSKVCGSPDQRKKKARNRPENSRASMELETYEEADDEVRVAGGADSKGGVAEVLEGELALVDDGAGIIVGLGVEPPEDLDDLFTT
ncbi:hypothetical protein ACFX1T_003844 [Malus domestica]